MLVDVVDLVGGGQHFAFVDKVDLQFLEDLRFHEMADAALGHHRDGNRFLDFLDHRRVGHARHAAGLTNVGGDPLQGHDGDGAGVFGDFGLVGIGDIHDDAPFEHLGQTDFGFEGSFFHLIPSFS